jgi:serine/threonine protein kinase
MGWKENQESETVVSYETKATATARIHSPDAFIGMTIKGRYLIERQLGMGGFGAVYLARDKDLLSKRVVIKVLRETAQQNEWVVKKFKHEIEALTRIDHPGIVRVLDTGSTPDGKPFIVMQYVEGVSLRDVMNMTPDGADVERAASIIRQMGHALTAAHEKGIVHRDLKPENVMIRSLSDNEEQVKIIDFGIAKVKDSRVAPSTVIAATAGTIAYMAPEQLNARPVSGAADTYSLGAIAFEMLTGRRPFNPETQFQLAEMQRKGVRVRPTDLRPGLPECIDNVILKALSYDPERRYLSTRAFADALADGLTENELLRSPRVSSQAVTRPMAPVPAVRSRKTKYGLIIAAAVVLLAVVAAGSRIWPRPSPKNAADKSAAKTTGTVAASSRTIDYYLMVQKYLPNGKPYQAPFKATGNDILGDGWQFRVHTSSPQDGFLYLVNEGPAPGGAITYNLLFPTPKLNGGSARVNAGQDLEVGPYGLDQQQGTEKFRLVWSSTLVAELEAVKGVANSKDKGTISDPRDEEAIRSFLDVQVGPQVEIDRANKVVHVKANSNVLVSLMELEHH